MIQEGLGNATKRNKRFVYSPEAWNGFGAIMGQELTLQRCLGYALHKALFFYSVVHCLYSASV